MIHISSWEETIFHVKRVTFKNCMLRSDLEERDTAISISRFDDSKEGRHETWLGFWDDAGEAEYLELDQVHINLSNMSVPMCLLADAISCDSVELMQEMMLSEYLADHASVHIEAFGTKGDAWYRVTLQVFSEDYYAVVNVPASKLEGTLEIVGNPNLAPIGDEDQMPVLAANPL